MAPSPSILALLLQYLAACLLASSVLAYHDYYQTAVANDTFYEPYDTSYLPGCAVHPIHPSTALHT